jgi:hypothetical protein
MLRTEERVRRRELRRPAGRLHCVASVTSASSSAAVASRARPLPQPSASLAAAAIRQHEMEPLSVH